MSSVIHPNEFISLEEAGRLLPRQRSVATLDRWSREGYEGVKLQTYKIGKQRVTTLRDILNFIADLNGYELQPDQVDEFYRLRESQRQPQQTSPEESPSSSCQGLVDAHLDDDSEGLLPQPGRWSEKHPYADV